MPAEDASSNTLDPFPKRMLHVHEFSNLPASTNFKYVFYLFLFCFFIEFFVLILLFLFLNFLLGVATGMKSNYGGTRNEGDWGA